jgi:undecaprenyl-diphosphatase
MKSRRWQRLSILSAAMLVMFVGFSRIALGAHYLSDIIAAFFLGVLWLMICALLLRPRRRSVVVPVAVAVEEPRPATAVTSVRSHVRFRSKIVGQAPPPAVLN